MEAMEILHRIVAADRAARERCEAAQQERDSFEERLEALRREAGDSAMELARREVEAAQSALAEKAAAETAALEEACRRDTEALRARFAAGKDAGVERMFRMVVGKDDP